MLTPPSLKAEAFTFSISMQSWCLLSLAPQDPDLDRDRTNSAAGMLRLIGRTSLIYY